MTKNTVIVIFLLFSRLVFAQFPEKELLKKLKADTIEMDQGNGDGVFKARNKKTKKWGMYQWMYKGLKIKEAIPVQYDSISFFPFNGFFTAVYNNGKVGFYLSAWSFESGKQTIPCLYEDYQRFEITNKDYTSTIYLAVKKNGKWGWVNWLSGEEKTEFIYNTKEDLPHPNYFYVQEYH